MSISRYTTRFSQINGMTKSLARELGEYNILINSIAPGYVNTEMTKKNVPFEEQYRRIKTGKQSFTRMTKEGKNIMPEVYACWGEIFKKAESMAGDKEYLDGVSKVITNFAELMEENQKNL